MLHAYFTNNSHSATSGTNENTFSLIYLTLLNFVETSLEETKYLVWRSSVTCMHAIGKKLVFLEIKIMEFFGKKNIFTKLFKPF